MTHVTKKNFHDVISTLEKLIPTASFIAIDEEMTGIQIVDQDGTCDKNLPNDKLQDRYVKMKAVAETYRIIQIGICLFHEVIDDLSSDNNNNNQDNKEKKKKYTATPFNFYLFPENGSIHMEGSAIRFNADHGMDFNKWIRDGIPYVTSKGEENFTQKMVVTDNRDATSSSPQAKAFWVKKAVNFLTTDDELYRFEYCKSEILASLGKFRTIHSDGGCTTITDLTKKMSLAVLEWFKEEPAETFLPIDKSQLKMVEFFHGGKFHLWFEYYTKEQLDIFNQRMMAKEKSKHLGFRLVWNMLTSPKCRAPILTHNGMFDLLFMWTHFENSTLPDTLDDFKGQLSSKFVGGVYDTKLISTKLLEKLTGSYKTALGPAFESIQKVVVENKSTHPLSIELDVPMDCKYASNGSCHEAAYDAWITGYIFLHMLALDGSDSDKFHNRMFNYNHPLVTRFGLDNDTGMTLSNEMVDQDCRVVLVQDFPKEWTTDDVKVWANRMVDDGHSDDAAMPNSKLVADYGIQVKWIDDDSLYLYVPSKINFKSEATKVSWTNVVAE